MMNDMDNSGYDKKMMEYFNDDTEKLKRFRKNLKKHLSNEYLILSERKDALESDVTQIKVEIERRDRTLFPSNEHGDARKYFSPLNLSEISSSQKNEKEKELNQKLENINKEISNLEKRMSEIMEFLRDADEMFLRQREESVIEKPVIPDHEADDINSLVEYYAESDPSVELLVECDQKDLKIPPEAERVMVSHVKGLIEEERKRNHISMVLLEIEDHRKDKDPHLSMVLSYDCENTEKIDNIRAEFSYKIKK